MDIASRIDHTVLKADCSKEEIKNICEEALTHQFLAVCIPPYYAKLATTLLKDSTVKVATVIGFPFGYSATAAKVEEIKRAINDGVDELDVMVNLAAIKDGNWSYVKNDIDSVTRAAHLRGKIVKIIFEVVLLTDEEIQKLCEICGEVEADFIRTSTMFNKETAPEENIKRLKKYTQDKIKIKASTENLTKEDAIKLFEAGADRIGCSSGIAIVAVS